jgi:hypothetical protein
MTLIRNTNNWIEHAKEIIFAEDGVRVSVEAKNKDLLKFGRNSLVNTLKSTIMTLPAGIDNEIFVNSNLINTMVSTNPGDTQTVELEGHTISGGLFTFVVQNVTLTGQTPVALSTPLARVSRIRNRLSATDLLGTIYVTETDTFSAGGVPNTPSKVHIMVNAGLNNSEKAATTISNNDYWLVTKFYGDCLEKTATYGTVHFEVRLPGGVFFNLVDIAASTNFSGVHFFEPYVIIKPNSDVRLRALSSAVGKDFSGGIQGVLLTAQ